MYIYISNEHREYTTELIGGKIKTQTTYVYSVIKTNAKLIRNFAKNCANIANFLKSCLL